MAFITYVAREVYDAVINAGAYLKGHEDLVDGFKFYTSNPHQSPASSLRSYCRVRLR